MRAITVTIYPNDGMSSALVGLSVSANLANLGQVSWAIDQNLTKVTPGNLSLKVWDEDGAVWAWVQNSIQTTVGSVSQLFPPWVVLTVSGVDRFLGILDVGSVKRDQRTQIVEFNAQDWSVMLRDQILEGTPWQRPLPKVISTRVGAGPYLGGHHPLKNVDSVIIFGPADLTGTLQVGDMVQVNGTGPLYKISFSKLDGPTGYTVLMLDGWTWATIGLGGNTGALANFSRVAASVGDQPYFTVTANVNGTGDVPVYEVPVDTVDQLVPGDVLEAAGKGKIRVDDLDSERKIIISTEPITTTLANGDRLTFSADSLNEVVHQSATDLIKRAAFPFAVDDSGFTPPTISAPAFAWLPWWNPSTDENLRAINDAEPTLTALRFFGLGQSWSGTPEAGYASAAGIAPRYVDWTRQQTSAPTYLMPDDTPSLTPRVKIRNRAFADWKFNVPKLLDSSWNSITADNTPVSTVYPAMILGHDYSALRRWRLSNASWTEERWNGTTWTATAAVTPSTTTGGPWYPCSAAPLVTQAATTGPTPLGKALLVLVTDATGSSYQLQLHFAAASAAQLAVSATQAKGAQLVSTPWGAYLVGPGGYGRITYSGGTLTLTWAQVVDATTCWLQPNTLAAIDSSSVWMLARLDYTNPETKETSSETRLFQLKATPDSSPILNGSDLTGVRISHLPPRICTMFRDPSDSTRLVGILGSRLFQVASKLPRTIERVRAYGMNAAELIEHTCQAINALAIPLPSGTLKIIARSDSGSSTAVTVDQTAISTSRVSPHFFTVVRVTGAVEDATADAYGLWKGGRALELSNHPMIWGEAQAFALASSMATFFGKPRRQDDQHWFHSDADTAPPWDALIPGQKITVNGGAAYLFMGLKEDLIKGEATATLLEA